MLREFQGGTAGLCCPLVSCMRKLCHQPWDRCNIFIRLVSCSPASGQTRLAQLSPGYQAWACMILPAPAG